MKKKAICSIDYDEIVIFQERINRFVVSFHFEKGDTKKCDLEYAHLHDTGRMRELLIRGNRLFVKRVENINRKTKWNVIAVEIEKNGERENILINTSFHREITEEILNNGDVLPFGKLKKLQAEVKYGSSRLDFFVENEENEKIFIETKGCTLVDEENRARFPGAPSTRATKHLKELTEIVKRGDRGVVLFLIFRNSNFFIPEYDIDPEFFHNYLIAKEEGVEFYGLLFSYKNKKIYFEKLLETY